MTRWKLFSLKGRKSSTQRSTWQALRVTCCCWSRKVGRGLGREKRPEPGPLWTPRGGGSCLQWRETTGRRCALLGSSLNTEVGNRPVETALNREADDEGTRWENVKCNREIPFSLLLFLCPLFPLCVPPHSVTPVYSTAPLLLGIPSLSHAQGSHASGDKAEVLPAGRSGRGHTSPGGTVYHWASQQML